MKTNLICSVVSLMLVALMNENRLGNCQSSENSTTPETSFFDLNNFFYGFYHEFSGDNDEDDFTTFNLSNYFGTFGNYDGFDFFGQSSSAFNCDQRLELDVEDQVRSLWKLGPVANTCYGSYLAEECAENNIPVVVSTGEGTVQEGRLTLARCVSSSGCSPANCRKMVLKTFYYARLYNAYEIVDIVNGNICDYTCCTDNVTCTTVSGSPPTDMRPELDSCKIDQVVSSHSMNISSPDLRRQGICRWNINASSPDGKIEIVFEPFRNGTIVDIFENNQFQTSRLGKGNVAIEPYISKTSSATVRIMIDPKLFNQDDIDINNQPEFELGSLFNFNLPSSPSTNLSYGVSASIKATSSAQRIFAEQTLITVVSSILIHFACFE